MSIKLSKLGEQATIIMGQSPPGESYNKDGNGVPLLNGPTEFGSLHPIEKQWTTSPKKFCQPGDILFCVRGATAGRLNLADKEYCLGRGLAAIRRKSGKFDSVFLRYVLSNGYASFQARGVGSTFINISKEELVDFEVPVLPLVEQRRIADILDRAEALRAKRRAALAHLDELTQSIFTDMFGDPATNPKGWDVKPLGAEIKSVRYGTSSPPKYVEEGIPFIRATNIKDGTINSKDLKRISAEDAEKLSKCRVSFGNLIVVRSGVNTGDCALIPIEYHGARAVFDLIVELSPANSVFYSFLINSPYGKRYLIPLTRRAAQPHLNADQLRKLVFIAPPWQLKDEFAHRIAAVEKLKAAHKASLAELAAFFASLQYRAFRGEL